MDVFAIIPLPHHLKASTHLLPPYPTPSALSNLQANQRSLLYNPLHNNKKFRSTLLRKPSSPSQVRTHTQTEQVFFLLCASGCSKLPISVPPPLRSCAKFKRLPVMTLTYCDAFHPAKLPPPSA